MADLMLDATTNLANGGKTAGTVNRYCRTRVCSTSRAGRAGMTVSTFLVESAPAIDPRLPAITLALTHADQQRC